MDSDSSSSHSRQETPPTAVAPIATVESATAFPPATPPQRRRSSAQVRPLLPSRPSAVNLDRIGQLPKLTAAEAQLYDKGARYQEMASLTELKVVVE